MPLLNTDEPIPDHLADTGRVQTVSDISAWRRVVGFVSLLGAAALTAATALLLLMPADVPTPTPNTDAATVISPTATTFIPPTTDPGASGAETMIDGGVIPTLSPEQAAIFLNAPLQSLTTDLGLEVVRNDYNPFTIAPERPRSEVVQYTVESGDTIYAIADRFGLKPESVAWANSRDIIGGLRPGRAINIPPVDGAFITVNNERSIASIAQEFRVDPYVIIDSEYNDFGSLTSITPETLLPSGTQVVIPGGEAEQISWNPTVERTGGDASNGNVGGTISFAPGDPGSCGATSNPGGGGGWLKPIGS